MLLFLDSIVLLPTPTSTFYDLLNLIPKPFASYVILFLLLFLFSRECLPGLLIFYPTPNAGHARRLLRRSARFLTEALRPQLVNPPSDGKPPANDDSAGRQRYRRQLVLKTLWRVYR